MDRSNLLRFNEVNALLQALDRLYQPVSRAEFPAHLFGVLEELLPDVLTSFDFVDLATGQVESHVTPRVAATAPVAQFEKIVRQTVHQNPVVPYYADGHHTAVVQPTDLVSQRQFRQTDFYQLAFRPLGIEYQIAGGLAWPGRAGGFIMNRLGSRNFTAREVEMVRRLRPHVQRAFAWTLRTPAGPPGEVPPTGCTAFNRLTDGSTSMVSEDLTKRENEVFHWLSAGKRNGEIAIILGISSRTVDKHVEHILVKLGVETRTAAAIMGRALRSGARQG